MTDTQKEKIKAAEKLLLYPLQSDRKVKRKIELAAELRERAEMITTAGHTSERVKTTTDPKKMEKLIIASVQLQEEAAAEFADAAEKTAKILRLLETLPQTQGEILYRHYIKGERLDDIADTSIPPMSYSKVYKAKITGLLRFFEVAKI